MRSRYLLVWAITCCLLPLAALAGQSLDTESGATHTNITRSLSNQSIAFTKNMGQWPDSIVFRASAGGTTMWFTRDGIFYQFSRHFKKNLSGEDALLAGLGPRRPDPSGRSSHEPDSIETDLVKAQFVGANPHVEVIGVEEQQYKCNYFLGNDPAKWHTDVPNYSAVTFKEIYPGVELTFRGNNGKLEYEVHGKVDAVAKVQATYRGGEVARASGGLVRVQTKLGEKTFQGLLPVSDASPVTTALVPASPQGNVTLLYSTYLGGSYYDEGWGIAVDAAGCAYVTGWTWSTNFPTQAPYQTDPGGNSPHAFVTKLSASGSSLVYSTYLGGNFFDYGFAIAVDAAGCAYVTGRTASYDFPTLMPFQTRQEDPDLCTDVFITKLSPEGNSLRFSTYLGGNGDDIGFGIAVDGSGYAYVAGSTLSTNFPTQTPIQATYSGGEYEGDAFVTKLSVDGSGLSYSTYLGGSGDDQCFGIAVDGAGRAYVTGYTSSTNFPIQMPYQANLAGVRNAFVTKLSASGTNLVYSTYLGGGYFDYGHAIAVDFSGYVYVTGETAGGDFPLKNPYQTDWQGIDAFVTKFSPAGNSLVFSSFLGGELGDYGFGIAVDGSGCVCVIGTTQSMNFPTQRPYQMANGGGFYDAFVSKFSAAGNSLVYSTYLGGDSTDYGRAIAVDGQGNVYVTGCTNSTDFPMQIPIQTHQGTDDAYVTKFTLSLDTDDDGVPDASDNCPTVSNPTQTDFDADLVGDVCDNCPLTANTTQSDVDLNGVGDLCQGSAALTQLGTNVAVMPVPGVTITFTTVSASGVTQVRQDNSGTPPPSGFTVYPTSGPIWYQIETGASSSGAIELCMHYNEATLTAPEEYLQLLHYTATGWIDITTSRDPLGNIICGSTTSLSPYILVEPCHCTGTTGNVNGAGIIDVSDLSLLVAYLTSNPAPGLPCPAEANINAVGIIDVSDLSLLVAYLTSSPPPALPVCP